LRPTMLIREKYLEQGAYMWKYITLNAHPLKMTTEK
jgi:hypothetical protein